MQTYDVQQRQLMGCGYEPPDPRLPAMPPSFTGREPGADEFDDDGREIHPVCPGYLCGLPEVVEASHAHLFLKNGGLAQFCDGKPPTSMLRDAVTILECEYGRVLDWSSKNPQKKAGA